MDGEFWYWWVASLAMIILSVFTPAPCLLWWGVASVVIGLLAWFLPALSWGVELIIFAIMAIGIIAIRLLIQQHYVLIAANPFLNQPVKRHIGRTLILTEPIVNGIGRVKIEGISWRIQGENMPDGATIKIVSADGATLLVERFD